MVPKGGLDRISLRDHAIGHCGRAWDFRAPKVALFLLFVGVPRPFSPPFGLR